MYEKVLAETGGAESIIVICGRYHTPAFVNAFRRAGHLVDETDVQNEAWYIEDWLEHMMRM